MPKPKTDESPSAESRARSKLNEKYKEANKGWNEKYKGSLKGSDRRDYDEGISRIQAEERKLAQLKTMSPSDKSALINSINRSTGTMEDVMRGMREAVEKSRSKRSGSGSKPAASKPRDRRAAALKAAQTRKMRGNAGRK